jgi:hypothetical protein
MTQIMKSRIIIILIIGTISLQSLYAQDYDYEFGIGARLGLAYGLNAKYFLRLHPTTRVHNALEGMLTTRYEGANATVLFEHHRDAFNTQGLNLYFGGGVHFGVWNSSAVDWDTEKTGYNPYTGLDAIIGMEYVIADLPVSVSLDWKPSVNFVSDLNLMIDELALSVRFLFK